MLDECVQSKLQLHSFTLVLYFILHYLTHDYSNFINTHHKSNTVEGAGRQQDPALNGALSAQLMSDLWCGDADTTSLCGFGTDHIDLLCCLHRHTESCASTQGPVGFTEDVV